MTQSLLFTDEIIKRNQTDQDTDQPACDSNAKFKLLLAGAKNA